ncbi:hypothetical protein D3C80_906820 [compost metagenome]
MAVSAPAKRSSPPNIRFSGAATMEPRRATSIDMTPASTAMPSRGQKRPLVMVQLCLMAIFCSAKVIGTAKLSRTASQIVTAAVASPASTAGRIRKGALMLAAMPPKTPASAMPANNTPSMMSPTTRVTARTRTSSLPKRI